MALLPQITHHPMRQIGVGLVRRDETAAGWVRGNSAGNQRGDLRRGNLRLGLGAAGAQQPSEVTISTSAATAARLMAMRMIARSARLAGSRSALRHIRARSIGVIGSNETADNPAEMRRSTAR